MKTSKSPLAVTVWAYAIGQKALPLYSHVKSPHKYTQPQIFALLILKQFFEQDYRGLVALVTDFSDIRKELELTVVPHYTTLQKAAKRLLATSKAQKLLQTTIAAAQTAELVGQSSKLSAMDSTGKV